MIIDARSIDDGVVIDGDLCIIGAGAAGITLAHALGGLGLRIIILEGGGLRFGAASQSLYEGDITGHAYELDTSRIRFLGGSTNAWSGFSHPFEQHQFAYRPWVPDSGWPLSRADLDPYYERAMELIGIDKTLFDRAPVRGFGSAWPSTTPESAANSGVVTSIAQVNRRRRRFGRVYRPELLDRSDVRLYLHANVTRIILDRDAAAVSAVDVACLDGPRFSVRARFIVLGCGGIENARVLLLSNNVQPAGLGNGYGLVGRYFMEHPTYTPARFELQDRQFPAELYDVCHALLCRNLVGALNVAAARQAQERILHGSIYIVPVYRGEDSPGVDALKAARKLLGRGMVSHALRHSLRILADGQDVLSFVYGFYSRAKWLIRDYELFVHLEQAPNPDSRVLLSERRDRLGLNKVRLDWQLTDLDQHTLTRTLAILDGDLRRRRIGRLLPVTACRARNGEPGWIWHHMGTTRMHPEPKRGVVDVDSRVHGIDNLFVAGSSVFPTSGNHTPTLTIVAMTLRLAEHLRQRLRQPPIVLAPSLEAGDRLSAGARGAAAAE